MKTAIFELKPENFAKLQVSFICGTFSMENRIMCGIVTGKWRPERNELVTFWTEWPNNNINGATLFGKFFRMEESR